MQAAEHIPAGVPEGVAVLDPRTPPRYAFSICTLMTRPDQYARMVRSYRDAGFGEDCEFLCIDNSRGNVRDAFSGYNAFLVEARGGYVVLTHQDVELCFDDRRALEHRLNGLDGLDPAWGACGNAGGVGVGETVMRMTDPHGEDRTMGDLPQRVYSLDENFIVVRRDANLGLSRDLAGYHLYGSDLCVLADVMGHHCYVIDFHLRHLSAGTIDADFRSGAEAFTRKYARAFRSRWLHTTVTDLFLSGAGLLRAAATSRAGRMLGIAQRRR